MDELDEDFKSLPALKIQADAKAREHVMRLLSILFLKIWMRFAIDLGLKMKMTPSSEDIALYEGKNKWNISKDFNFEALSEISLSDNRKRAHALRAETFTVQGREHVRIVFSLEEERVKNQPVMVSYSVYSSLAKDFSVEDALKNLKPGLGKWYLAHVNDELSILWNYCKDKYEFVGV